MNNMWKIKAQIVKNKIAVSAKTGAGIINLHEEYYLDTLPTKGK